MNRSHRSLYNAARGTWVAAPETARSTRKGRGSKAGAVGAVSAAVTLAVLLTTPAFALDANTLPAGGRVSAGAGSLATSGTTLTVNQTSQKMAIDWNSFSIGSAATVNFVQPGASAIALNRVTGSDRSQIYGKLNANGQVFLLNPSGVLFAKGAEVNVGGLVASTLSLSNADFMASNFRFSGTAGSVVNQGDITVADKGYVALLGGQISNQGAIVARLGKVYLAAGSDITLDFAGDGLINLQVNQGAVNALAENRQLIRADGGAVLMTAKAADALIRAVVNNEGVVEARTVDASSGTIKLLADMDNGITRLSGTLDASAPTTGNGGFVETSGQKVTVAEGAKVTTRAANGKTGTWLIDPDGYTIAASGGDISGATLSGNLAGGNITIQSTSGNGSDGNVNVNDTVSWSANTLKLHATNNININAAMNGSGSAGLALEYGQGAVAAGNTATYKVNAPVNLASTGTFSSKLGNDGTPVNYTIITSLGAAGSTSGADLQGMGGNLSGHYVLGANIDASGTIHWNGGAGFVPVGTFSVPFTSVFDGLGHTISNLTINRPGTDFVGLFGFASGTVRNVGLTATNVRGRYQVGGLAGENKSGTISNSYAAGSVSGSIYVGGLVGKNDGTISHSYAAGSVSGSDDKVGGLVGQHRGGTISNSYATGSVSGHSTVGGLVGDNSGTINNSYATGSISGTSTVGGLVGWKNSGTISNSYATGSVSGTSNVDGLVGWHTGGSIDNSHYDIEASGLATVTRYGLYHSQFQDWINGGRSLAVGNYFTADGSGSYRIGSVQNLKELLGFAETSGYRFILTADLDLGGLTGFYIPIFSAAHFDGSGHTLSNFTFSNSKLDNVGFIGTLGNGGTVTDLGMNNVHVTGRSTVGGLVGRSYGTLSNSYAAGSVSGTENVGGLVGQNASGTISNSYATGTVSGTENVGGLVGQHRGGTISNSYATGSVSGTSNVGGLAGYNTGTLSNAYFNSSVNPTQTTCGTGCADNGGRTTAQLAASLAGLGFSASVWGDADNQTTPYLLSNASFSTASGSVILASDTSATPTYYNVILNAAQLQNINTTGLAGKYVLGRNIDASATSAWNGGAGFIPVGNLSASFTGVFDGLGHTISNLTINRPGTDYVGLFGFASGTFRNVGLTAAAVSGKDNVGGLVGLNVGHLSNSYATGSVSGVTKVGGLVGWLTGGTISNSYASATVSGSSDVGGLVGNNSSSISNSYTTGTVTGSYNVGGLVGNNSSSISNSFFDTASTGQSSACGVGACSVTGLATAGMETAGNFSAAGWDISSTGGSSSIWRIYDGATAPLLRSFLTPLTISASGGSMAYTGTTDARAALSYSATADASLLLGTLSAGTSSRNVGSYTVTPSGLYSGQQGYDISYVSGTVNITPATLTITALADSKTYDGTTSARATPTVSGLVGSDTVSGLAETYDNKNAGSNKTMTVSAYTVNDGNSGNNYAVTTVTDSTGAIARKDATVSGSAASVAYNGSTQTQNAISSGLVSGDNIAISGLASGKNAGTYASALSVGGSDIGNYNITVTSADFTIAKAPLTIAALADSKTYDGTTSARATPTVSGLVGSDTVSGLAETYDNRNAGSNKTMTVSAYTVNDGNSGNNYAVTTVTDTTGAIAQAPLTITALADSKTYDGTTSARARPTVSGLVGADTVTGLAETYDNRNAGSNKTMTVSAYTVNDGNSGNNYAVTTVTDTTGAIAQAPLTITANDANRTANGAAYSGGNGVSYSGFVGGETNGVLGGTLTYTGSSLGAIDPGTYAITPRGLTSGNYAIAFVNGQLTILPGAPYVSAVYAADIVGQTTPAGNAGAATSAQTPLPAPAGGDLAFQAGRFSLHVIDGGVRLPVGLAREALPPLAANAASGND